MFGKPLGGDFHKTALGVDNLANGFNTFGHGLDCRILVDYSNSVSVDADGRDEGVHADAPLQCFAGPLNRARLIADAIDHGIPIAFSKGRKVELTIAESMLDFRVVLEQ